MRFAAVLVAALVFTTLPTFADPIRSREVTVSHSRVRVGDIVGGLALDLSSLDLGPAPAPGGSRIIERDEVLHALGGQETGGAVTIPRATRVLRRTRRLDATDVERFAHEAEAQGHFPRGVTLTAVHGRQALDVPDGFTRVTCVLPRPPRRTGSLTSALSLTFYEDAVVVWNLSVPVDLSLSAEAAIPDVVHGTPIKVVVRRGLVEVSASATAGADADVGDVLPLVLHPSGRTILGRLEDKEHALELNSP